MWTSELLQNLLFNGIAMVMACLLILAGKLLFSITAGFSVKNELYLADNPAAGFAATGFTLAIAAVIVGAFAGPLRSSVTEVMTNVGYALLGIVLVIGSRFVNSAILFHSFDAVKQKTAARNASVGVVRGASYLATGLVAAGALLGDGGVASAVVFFLLGQAALLIFARVYEKLSRYDLHDEMEKGNAAAGIGFAGHILALSIIIAAGVTGDFVSWSSDILNFVLAVISGFVFLPVGRWFLDFLLLPKRRLSQEIVEDKNLNGGLIEAAAAITIACAMASSL
jgi:uncharacterized membrane protein YjfL (UPF0719 family)